ncbi:MAG: tRNA (adenosine(37)-N6)-threonylcarbamoyltransferase complex ATPase subunit type 1 TsaE [Actinomycetota bacterium]|nr:tRNA (adenosine(37)-N6)-threonylcarbamoyltransferase complex ATPase subunit type 1 TsaE [Actinomycetota bacterium]
MQRALSVVSRSPEETRILGASLAPVLLPGDVISLSGDLGAGKTVLVQGLATALGVQRRVTSPTFVIVHEYEGRFPILHLDVYRLDSFQEVIDLGFEELLDPEAILVVEWGNAVAPLLPRRHLDIVITHLGADAPEQRSFVFQPSGPEWVFKVDAMRTTAETLLNAASPDEVAEQRFSETLVSPVRDHREPRQPGEA